MRLRSSVIPNRRLMQEEACSAQISALVQSACALLCPIHHLICQYGKQADFYEDYLGNTRHSPAPPARKRQFSITEKPVTVIFTEAKQVSEEGPWGGGKPTVLFSPCWTTFYPKCVLGALLAQEFGKRERVLFTSFLAPPSALLDV
ncbi:hypothetical protein CB1_000349020 [Camelus ferus]|nr:hypothetical protein CB1_000349020 [Camelus ferus]